MVINAHSQKYIDNVFSLHGESLQIILGLGVFLALRVVLHIEVLFPSAIPLPEWNATS